MNVKTHISLSNTAVHYMLSYICFLSGLSFQDFYQRCREAFLVNSDLTLRTQLTEFRDHKLIRTRKVGLPIPGFFPAALAAHDAVFLPLTVALTQTIELLFLPAVFLCLTTVLFLTAVFVLDCSIVTDYSIIVPHCSIFVTDGTYLLVQGADGVEYLNVPVDTSTLLDFLEKEEGD